MNQMKVNILAQSMAALNIAQVHQLNGHIQIVEGILDYMKMEKKNAKNVGQKICFAIGIMLGFAFLGLGIGIGIMASRCFISIIKNGSN